MWNSNICGMFTCYIFHGCNHSTSTTLLHASAHRCGMITSAAGSHGIFCRCDHSTSTSLDMQNSTTILPCGCYRFSIYEPNAIHWYVCMKLFTTTICDQTALHCEQFLGPVKQIVLLGGEVMEALDAGVLQTPSFQILVVNGGDKIFKLSIKLGLRTKGLVAAKAYCAKNKSSFDVNHNHCHHWPVLISGCGRSQHGLSPRLLYMIVSQYMIKSQNLPSEKEDWASHTDTCRLAPQ